MTKSQINKLGKRLKKKIQQDLKQEEKELIALQEYRTSFKEDIAPVFNLVSKLSKDERSDSIVSFRIKRIESILSKIKREPTMALSNMGDIAGCRIILYAESALKNLVATIHKEFTVKHINDYTLKAKEDGYQGYHIYVESPLNPGKTIEIQLRTIQTHRWASLVEIIDILYDLKLKEGAKHPRFQEFIKLLSYEKKELTINQKRRIIDIDDKLKVYQKLLEVFINNNIAIRETWLEISQKIDDKYFIFEVDQHNKSSIVSIGDYHTAEAQYFNMFRTNNTSNFVLTHISKPNFNRVCVAYASYMMTKHDYLKDWNRFAIDILQHDSKHGKRSKFKLYDNIISRNLEDQMALLVSESDELTKRMDNLGTESTHDGLSEWLQEIDDSYSETEKMAKQIQKLRPQRKSFFSWLMEN